MMRRGISRRSLLISSVAAAGAAAAGIWAWNWLDESTQSSGTRGKSNLIPTSDPLALVAGKLLDTNLPRSVCRRRTLGLCAVRF